MKGNLYKIIAAAFVLVLLLGEVALFLANQNTTSPPKEEFLQGVYEVQIVSWKPFFRLYGERPTECVEKVIQGRDYYVVEFNHPLCAFLYNTTVSTTLAVENATLTTYLPPIAPPGYYFMAYVDGKVYDGRVVALSSFQPQGKDERKEVVFNLLRKRTEYKYTVPFKDRRILEELNLSQYIKDIVLVENASAYASFEGVKAVGDGYLIVERNITNLSSLGIEGTPVPSVVVAAQPIEGLEDYQDAQLSHYYIYSNGTFFVPPYEYVSEENLTFPCGGVVEGFLSGNTFLSVSSVNLYTNSSRR